MKPILEYFKEIISESSNPFVIEIGCCDGSDTRQMIQILDSNGKPYKYHCFEPNKDLLKSIEANVKRAKHGVVSVYIKAIGAEDKSGAMFYKSGGERIVYGKVQDKYYGSSSIRKPKLVLEAWKDMTFEETACDIVTLETHIKESGMQDIVIDFIHADTQGAEVDMILGGYRQIENNVRYLYTEYCDSELYDGEIPLKAILALLPTFEIVENYGGDILLKNQNFIL